MIQIYCERKKGPTLFFGYCIMKMEKVKFMFYDENFSNVAGTDNFGNIFYSKEYGPNGEILH